MKPIPTPWREANDGGPDDTVIAIDTGDREVYVEGVDEKAEAIRSRIVLAVNEFEALENALLHQMHRNHPYVPDGGCSACSRANALLARIEAGRR